MFEKDLARLDQGSRIVHFEMGKHLRELAAGGSYTGKLLQEVIARGELVPFNISSSVFTDYLIKHLQGNDHLIIDGFPRSEEQMLVVDATMAFYKCPQVTVVHTDISDGEGIKRLLARGRADDKEELIRKRLAWTRQEWEKIRAKLQANAMYKVVEIQGEQSIEDVHKEILSKLGFS